MLRHYGVDDCLLQDHVRPPVIQVDADLFDRLTNAKKNGSSGRKIKNDETKLISAFNQAKIKIKSSDTNEDIVKVNIFWSICVMSLFLILKFMK